MTLRSYQTSEQLLDDFNNREKLGLVFEVVGKGDYLGEVVAMCLASVSGGGVRAKVQQSVAGSTSGTTYRLDGSTPASLDRTLSVRSKEVAPPTPKPTTLIRSSDIDGIERLAKQLSAEPKAATPVVAAKVHPDLTVTHTEGRYQGLGFCDNNYKE